MADGAGDPHVLQGNLEERPPGSVGELALQFRQRSGDESLTSVISIIVLVPSGFKVRVPRAERDVDGDVERDGADEEADEVLFMMFFLSLRTALEVVRCSYERIAALESIMRRAHARLCSNTAPGNREHY